MIEIFSDLYALALRNIQSYVVIQFIVSTLPQPFFYWGGGGGGGGEEGKVWGMLLVL